MGSSEGGMGSAVSNRENPAKTAKFSINPGVIVVTDEGEEVEPGSNQMGKIGTSGLVPEGYYKDQKKSDEVYETIINFCRKYEELCKVKYPEAPLPLEITKNLN